MDKYFSQKDLDKVYRKEIKEKGKATFERSLENKSLHHGKKNSARHIFLCHAHVDKIYAFFKTLNVELYIDWMDHSLPEFTNALTASSVKRKIDESSKFIFLATARALTSRWCNWELGLAYSRKDLQLAIFPIETWTGKWAGNEYLHLYPVIERSAPIETLTIDDLKVHAPDKQIIEFRNWLGNT